MPEFPLPARGGEFLTSLLGVSWDERFGELLAYTEEYGDTNVHQNMESGLGRWVSTQRVALKNGSLGNERKDRLEKIKFIWDPNDLLWENMFEELIKYMKVHGNSNISSSRHSDLGRWASTQRANAKTGLLSPSRKARLDKVAFNFDLIGSAWQEMYDELIAFKEDQGHADVPIKFPGNLGSWVSIQRKAYKEGSLSQDRKTLLDEIGFSWDAIDSKWNEMYENLVAYKQEHGHTNIPQRPATLLGNWVRTQISAARKGRLTAERKLRLENVGMKFDYFDSKWDERLNELIEYKEMHGNVNAPNNWPTGLGHWISRQRVLYKNGELPTENKMRLEAIGLKWNAFDDKWNKMYAELVEYKLRHGTTATPESKSSGLGRWISAQRKAYKNNNINADRKNKLDEIGFLWQINKRHNV